MRSPLFGSLPVPPPMLRRRPSGWLRIVFGCLFASLCLAAVSAAPDAARRTYNVPSGEATQALKLFSQQSGRGVIVSAEVAGAVRTRAIQGEMTAQEAIDQMLGETGLVAREDSKTGAFAIRREETPEKNGASRPGETRAARTELPVGKLDAYMVNATKVDGLVNRGLLQAGENAPLYHDVVTRADIERMGVSSMEELFRYLPQTSSATTALQTVAGNTSISGGLTNRYSTVGLRGFSSGQTVVLINGRALPRSGTGPNGGADIGRVPIAAIERVEILPYSGSAIYGAGALGGAINIILRKEFTGRDLTTYIGTATEGGATEYRFTYLDGRTFNGGKTSLTTTFSYQHREGLTAGERGYLDEALRRYGPNSTATNAQGVRLFEQLILPAFAGSPATLLVGNTPTAAVNDLGIPGAPGVRYAAIPAGTTAAQSLALTPESFSGTAGKAALSPRYGRSILYEPVDAYSFNAQLSHAFIPKRLEGYGEFTVGYNRKEYSMPQNFNLSLSATDPLNPFRTNVTPGFVGRPVTVLIDTPEIPDASVLYEYDSARAVVGLKGEVGDRVEWSVDGTIDYSHSTVNSNNPITNFTALQALSPFASPGPAAPVATRRAVYPLLADHSRYPIPAADVANYFESVRYSTNLGKQYEGNARVMARLIELPAGPLRVSGTAKRQQWDFRYGQKLSGSAAWSTLVNNGPYLPNESSTTVDRKIWQGAVELSAPVISEKWRPIPIHSLDLQGSVSRERDLSGGVDSNLKPFENKQSATSSVVAAKLQVTRDIAFRASYSEGFYPPEWSDVSLPVTPMTVPGVFPDPKRGNTLQFTPTISVLQGGNPGLLPESAESENYGIMLTPRFLPGFSLNVDYWKIVKVDAIVSTSFVSIIANPDAFGFLITREAATPADTAQGWLGRITAVDARAFNASITRTEGADIRARYNLDMDTLGEFAFNASATFTNHFYLQSTPTSAAFDMAGGSGPVRWRGNASVTWTRNPWSVSVTGRYMGHRSTTTTTASPSFPGGYPLDGDRLPAFLRWDLQASYDVGYKSGAHGWRNWVQGTRWTVGALNVLNDEPTFTSDSSQFYNGSDDPRQRFVYVQAKKSF
ncbi:MAG: TonB-dependent receptor [Opitutaceae bacterium]|nr:TonB-dependent receptor [Opitutaceae bacterium]